MERPFHHHGGRLAAARAAYPRAPKPWLDLSTGINPEPWAGPRPTAADLARLPDPEELAVLEAVAAAAFGVAPDRVAAVPGAEAALRALPRLLGVRGVDILSPTYGGHAEAWRAAGFTPNAVASLDEATSDAVVLVNPNNPDGRRHEAKPLAETARWFSGQGRWLIVDESFVEAAPELSVAAETASHLVVLRSFGKFYGLPGVRLGFVIGAPDLIAKVRAQFGDWPVSAEAIVAGTAAYADAGWRASTLARLTADAQRLDQLLIASGFEILGGAPLFRLAISRNDHHRLDILCRHGILTRPFPHDPSWLRFGLPNVAGWPRLQAALETLA